MPLLSGINRISKRLGLPWHQALSVEIFVRLYRNKYFRSFARIFFPKRMPKGVLFVIGCYNSGTTVVKNAISLHPQITSAPIEGDRLTSALSSYENGSWPRCLYGNCYVVMQDRNHDEVIAGDFYSDLRPWIKENKYFLEKSISNTVRIPLLRRAFPDTRFVCVVREADGVISGIQRRSSPQGLASKILGAEKYSKSLLERQWRFFYSLVLNDLDTVKNDIYFCSYEKFLEQPNIELERIYAFLGLHNEKISFHDSMLRVDERSLHIRNENMSRLKDQDYLDSAENLHSYLESLT